MIDPSALEAAYVANRVCDLIDRDALFLVRLRERQLTGTDRYVLAKFCEDAQLLAAEAKKVRP